MGLGHFGASVAVRLAQRGYEVLAVDDDQEAVTRVSAHVTNTMRANLSDEAALRSLGLGNFDVVVVAIDKDWVGCLLATTIAKELGAPQVIAKAATDMQKRILQKVGADKVALPEKEMGTRVADSLISGINLDFIELTNQDQMSEIPVLPEWSGKTLAQVNMRNKYDLNVVCIIRDGVVDIAANAKTVLRVGEVLVVVGKKSCVEKVIERLH